jgi:hypothetical protein
MMKQLFQAISLAVVLSACSPDQKIAEDQREVMDEAKEVENVLQQSAEQTNQQVDEQAQ